MPTLAPANTPLQVPPPIVPRPARAAVPVAQMGTASAPAATFELAPQHRAVPTQDAVQIVLNSLARGCGKVGRVVNKYPKLTALAGVAGVVIGGVMVGKGVPPVNFDPYNPNSPEYHDPYTGEIVIGGIFILAGIVGLGFGLIRSCTCLEGPNTNSYYNYDPVYERNLTAMGNFYATSNWANNH